MLRRFKCSAVTLGVFTEKLPNSRGLARGHIDQERKDGRAIQKALGVGPTVEKAPPTGAGRGRGAAPSGYSALTGFSAQRAPPVGFAPLAAGGWRGGATAAQSVVLPLLSAAGGTARSKNGKGRQGVGREGQGIAPLQPPLNRARSAIARFNSVMQEEQQQFQQVQGGPTCGKCTAGGTNPNHDHRICAFVCCSRCRRGGYQGSVCP